LPRLFIPGFRILRYEDTAAVSEWFPRTAPLVRMVARKLWSGTKDVCCSCIGLEKTMSHRTFSLTAGVVFLLIALGHLLRFALGATFVVEGIAIPMWPSILAVILTGYLAFEGFRLSSRPKSG
jgi:hypothetical protein